MAAASTRELRSLEELAAYGGLSESTIHRLKRAGKIPYFQPAGKGGRVLFPADALEKASPAHPYHRQLEGDICPSINDVEPSETPKPATKSPRQGKRPRWMIRQTTNKEEAHAQKTNE